jgi:hypothetical protein
MQIDHCGVGLLVNRVGCAARSGSTGSEVRPFPRSLPPNPAGAF